MTELKRVIMERDGMSSKEANEIINDAQERVFYGENPEEILRDEFSLEPDFIFDLMG